MGFGGHLEQLWPSSAHEDIASTRPAIEDLLAGFRVRRIAPANPGEPWVYATLGAAQAAAAGEDGAEFIVLAPDEDPVLVEMLAALATVNAQPDTRLGVGSVVALRRPWTVGSAADQLLVLPPYVFDPGFEVYEDDERRVVVLWLVPITAAEARYVRAQGYEALEQLIAHSGANLADPTRASVV